jgi:hypothetical protein
MKIPRIPCAQANKTEMCILILLKRQCHKFIPVENSPKLNSLVLLSSSVAHSDDFFSDPGIALYEIFTIFFLLKRFAKVFFLIFKLL